MTENERFLSPGVRWQNLYILISIVSTAVILILTAAFSSRGVPFWQITTTDVIQLMTSLILVSLFIERAIEVFIVSWRGKEKEKLVGKLSSVTSQKKHEGDDEPKDRSSQEISAQRELGVYSAQTQKLSMLTALGLGIAVSALGIRALQPLVDPITFGKLGSLQKSLFEGVDALITGALLGGGSEGIHRILDYFLSIVEQRRVKAKREIAKAKG